MRTHFKIACTSAAIAALAACSGGGGGDSSPVASTTTVVPVTVLDGLLQNAQVCQDRNNDGLCNPGEPSAQTNADGVAQLSVEVADKDTFPLLAMVSKTTSIDKDTGPVPVAYVMKTPAGKPALISPLTTLVQNLVASSGQTWQVAEAQLQQQTGVTSSLFASFTSADANPADGSPSPAKLARLLVLTAQQQAQTLATAVNSSGTAPDGSSITITQAQLDLAVQKKVQELLPSVVAALASAATSEEGLLAAAAALVASEGLNDSNVATAIAINTKIASGSTPASTNPAASASLVYLLFESSNDWSLVAHASTAAENTRGSDGNFRWRQVKTKRENGGSPYSWADGGSPSKGSRIHWSGSTWGNCAINFQSTSTSADSNGATDSRSSYSYCDASDTGIANPAARFSLADRRMVDVYREVRAAGYTNMDVATSTSTLGEATFPAGSSISYGSGTTVHTAIFYEPVGNSVEQIPLAAAAGRVDPGTDAACAHDPQPSPSVTLEGMVAAFQGTPCIYNPQTITGTGGVQLSSGPRNEWWGWMTLGLHTVGSAPSSDTPTTSYYTGNTELRFAFAGTTGNAVNYYRCSERYQGWTGNCDLAGTTTYAIQTMGDARVLTFAKPHPDLVTRGWTTVFVERGGRVYYGYQEKALAWRSANLNLVAMNALFAQLGMPALDPNAPVVLTTGSYQGRYGGSFNGSGTGTFYASLAGNGTTDCGGYKDGNGNFACIFTLVPSSVDSTMASFQMAITGVLVNFTGTLNYNTGQILGTWVNNADPAENGAFTGAIQD